MKFEDPIQFNIEKHESGVKIHYSNLMEISQGGPEIGDLYINGELVQGFRFGGPCIVTNEFIVAPVYVKKFFGTGFKLSRIQLTSLRVDLYGSTKSLIYLDRIDGMTVYFFEDINKTISRSLNLS